MEHSVHDPESLVSVHGPCVNSHLFEILYDVRLYSFEAGFRVFKGTAFYAESQILAFHKSVVSLRELIFEERLVFAGYFRESVVSFGDADAVRQAVPGSRHIHEGKLETDRGIEIVEKIAP